MIGVHFRRWAYDSIKNSINSGHHQCWRSSRVTDLWLIILMEHWYFNVCNEFWIRFLNYWGKFQVKIQTCLKWICQFCKFWIPLFRSLEKLNILFQDFLWYVLFHLDCLPRQVWRLICSTMNRGFLVTYWVRIKL